MGRVPMAEHCRYLPWYRRTTGAGFGIKILGRAKRKEKNNAIMTHILVNHHNQ